MEQQVQERLFSCRPWRCLVTFLGNSRALLINHNRILGPARPIFLEGPRGPVPLKPGRSDRQLDN